MPPSSDPEFELAVLDMIEHSPVGSVPRTPTYDEAIGHLRATHQVYVSADHKDGYVTARSLTKQPTFHAANLEQLTAGSITPDTLESNTAIFDRYVQSLPQPLRPKAESFRAEVAGRVIHHRPKAGGSSIHDPLASMFLVPGGGPHPGMPGNYLFGMVMESHDPRHPEPWRIVVKDTANDTAVFDAATMTEALTEVQELLESAPFHLVELESLGFRVE